VANVVDPLGGSYFVERLTDDMEREALEVFRAIDDLGGMVAAIEQGYPQKAIAESAYLLQQAIERREKVIVGVNDFVAEAEEPIPTLYIDEAAAERQLSKLEQVRRERDNGQARRALDDLKRVAAGSGNTMEPILAAVRAYATVGEMCDALRDVWGEFEEVPVI